MDEESIKTVVNHTVPITVENIFSRSLTLEDIDFFFDIILEMSDGKADSSPNNSASNSNQVGNNSLEKEKQESGEKLKKNYDNLMDDIISIETP